METGFGTFRSEIRAIQGGNVTKSAILEHTNVGKRLITRTKRVYISRTRCTYPFLRSLDFTRDAKGAVCIPRQLSQDATLRAVPHPVGDSFYSRAPPRRSCRRRLPDPA